MTNEEIRIAAKAFFMGVKEFGVEEAVARIAENIKGDDDESAQIFVMAFASIFTLFMPEIVNNEDFIKAVDSVVSSMPKEEVDHRIDMILEQM